MAIKTIPFFLVLLICCNSCSHTDTVKRYSPPVPPVVPKYEFIQYKKLSSKNYFLLTPSKIENGNLENINLSLLDHNGNLKWWKPANKSSFINFQFHLEQQCYSFVRYGSQELMVIIVNQNFQIIDSLSPKGDVDLDIHEFDILKNGNYLIAGLKIDSIDMSEKFIGGTKGKPNVKIKGFVIQEMTNDHQMVFEWNSNDHIEVDDFIESYKFNFDLFNYCHGNAIHEDSDGNFLISFRNLNSIYKIDRTSGEVIWILGGKSSHFQLLNDSIPFSGQHDSQTHGNGRISLFDNANSSEKPKISRGIEYVLNEDDRTYSKVWEYYNKPASFSRAMGNLQVTGNGQRVVGFGLTYRPNPSVVLLDRKDHKISEIHLQDSVFTYRAFLVKIPDELPNFEIEKRAINLNSISLTAPDGFEKYIWNTGADSKTITVDSSGTYQAWMNYGIGMIGSEPILIEINLE